MLKLTENEFIGMILILEKETRGGEISQCSNRYAKTNNKCMINYDKTESSNYLMQFDAMGLQMDRNKINY